MKKLACFAGVVLSYFSIFFFGQITFAHSGETIYVRLQISITDGNKFARAELRGRDTNQTANSNSGLFFKTFGNTIYLLGE